MMNTELTLEQEALPYLVFCVKNNRYAISSENIAAIMQFQGCQSMPQSAPWIMGVFMFRDKVAPVIDIRSVFGLPSLEQEQQEFADMLEQRKQDHIHWVEELSRCLETGERFSLATDPHQCAFGKWYDQFQSQSNNIMFHLRKIEEPHENLHLAADQVMKCKQEHAHCKRETCLKVILKQVQEQYVPTVLRLLEETKTVFKESYREMLIILGTQHPIGLLVDEVLAVEFLEKGEELDGVNEDQNGLIVRTMRGKHDESLIYLLDDKGLLSRYQKAT